MLLSGSRAAATDLALSASKAAISEDFLSTITSDSTMHTTTISTLSTTTQYLCDRDIFNFGAYVKLKGLNFKPGAGGAAPWSAATLGLELPSTLISSNKVLSGVPCGASSATAPTTSLTISASASKVRYSTDPTTSVEGGVNP